MGSQDLPDKYTLSHWTYISGKSLLPMLQLILVQHNNINTQVILLFAFCKNGTCTLKNVWSVTYKIQLLVLTLKLHSHIPVDNWSSVKDPGRCLCLAGSGPVYTRLRPRNSYPLS